MPRMPVQSICCYPRALKGSIRPARKPSCSSPHCSRQSRWLKRWHAQRTPNTIGKCITPTDTTDCSEAGSPPWKTASHPTIKAQPSTLREATLVAQRTFGATCPGLRKACWMWFRARRASELRCVSRSAFLTGAFHPSEIMFSDTHLFALACSYRERRELQAGLDRWEGVFAAAAFPLLQHMGYPGISSKPPCGFRSPFRTQGPAF